MADRDEIQRFTMAERLIHWAVAISFVYLVLSGLALFHPSFYWLAYVLGGGPVIRQWHPIVGVLMFVFLTAMYLKWRRDMKLDDLDRRWLRQVHKYIRHEEGVPEAGRFNAGQKLLFKTMTLMGVLLLLSGIPLWFPMRFSRNLREWSILVHEVAALVAIGGLIAHIYMGTAVVRGSMRAMLTGWVSRAWARAHHPRWAREFERTS
ncbi:Formate dehydrogenase, cytochrome b556(fdo) subunit [bacterium HR11]|nr:Formate dehydrogenase, cytochrome b556(fdo) subunit [bacterium HR11]